MLGATSATEDKKYSDFIAQRQDQFGALVNQAEHLAPDVADEIAAVEAAETDLVKTTCANAIALASNPSVSRSVAQTAYFSECRPKFADVSETSRVATQHLLSIIHSTDIRLSKAADHTIFMTFAIILLGMVAVLTGGFLAVQAWIIKPLNKLENTMGELSQGNLTVDVIGTDRVDEIGRMAKAVQVFKDAGLEKVRLEDEAAAARRANEEERGRREAERESGAKQLALVVEALALGLKKLEAGILTFRLDQGFAPEYERLRTDFNAAMERLQDTMKVIVGATSVIHSGTGEISAAADDLSRRTEQQAASLEETAAALDEITATVRQTAEGAAHAREVFGTAQSNAKTSSALVGDAVAAMSRIEASSQQISSIIGVIDEIAFQTNLLALNAGVEAARAGDAGRGFAVVASEVRALAQRSAEAAKEIKALISASSQEVGSGVDLVGRTGSALEQIVGQISEINEVVVQIANSAQEQATGLNQVNAAVNQMDQVTQQNAAMVEQSTAASHSLAKETDELAALIGRFEIGKERTSAPAAPRKPAARNVPHGSIRTTPHPVMPPKSKAGRPLEIVSTADHINRPRG
ncbi:methyl-accepting chemotaxis protein [Acidocella aminolytica 101 = DSM 11237]|nr:methyl-accepting chemotaxis protein [Acidocella aminolytica 101 = DSM 11237]